ncbi:MAG: enoyl-CoA hydratase/isomerase family protein [Planctomycetota bacterium]
MPDHATLAIDGSIATLTLERAEKRNALSLPLLDSARAHVAELSSNTAVRALVLTGAGRAFCAGMDLRAVLDEPGAPHRLLDSIAELAIALVELDTVVIAAVNGAAIGGGCGLACAADLAITHAEATLGFPEVDLGLCPAVVAPWVHRRLGGARARQVLLTGGTMTGLRAAEIGLVDALVPTADDVLPEATERARTIAGGGAEALAATKHLLSELDGARFKTLSRSGAALSASVLAGPEAQARLRGALSG